MDPVSQGALGAIAALCFSKREHAGIAALAGSVGGMLADADVLIRSDLDPLLAVEYHRHFTHALAFIPCGGLLATLLLYPLWRKRIRFAEMFLYCLAGYATAGLLDACTSYGTQLLWPFSNARISWNIISIVDPLFTVPLLAFVFAAWRRRAPAIARIGALFVFIYLGLGLVQRERASALQAETIEQRGHHEASARTVKPSLGNLILWRSVYIHEGRYYVDAVRVGLPASRRVYQGDSTPEFPLQEALARYGTTPAAQNDLQRYYHFSDAYVVPAPGEPTLLNDLRYATLPDSIDPLWALDLSDTNPTGHAAFVTRRQFTPEDRAHFLQMLLGE